MKRISVELVPRDALREELAVLKEGGFAIDLINIPDLLRFPTRSWEGAALAQQYFPTAMPHIRAMTWIWNGRSPWESICAKTRSKKF